MSSTAQRPAVQSSFKRILNARVTAREYVFRTAIDEFGIDIGDPSASSPPLKRLSSWAVNEL